MLVVSVVARSQRARKKKGGGVVGAERSNRLEVVVRARTRGQQRGTLVEVLRCRPGLSLRCSRRCHILGAHRRVR